MATTVEEITNAVLKPRRTSAKSWVNDRIARSQDGPFIDIVDLTPDLAKEILAKNEDNRRVSADTVDKYARDIANGDWEFNGQTLVLAVDGCQNDGQHRCLAVIKANKSIKTAIDTLNYATLLFLINKDLRAVAGIYEAEEEKGQKPVPRAIFKTLDPEVWIAGRARRHGE